MRSISYLLNRGRDLNSRLILALDIHSQLENSLKSIDSLLSNLKDYVVAVKIGLPTILCFGLNTISEFISKYPEYYYIADLKIADVGHINKIICQHLDSAGFDAVISHAFIGYRNGLNVITDYIHSRGGSVFTVCAMTHEGAEEILNKNFTELLELSILSNVDGFILPATQPKYITLARERVGSKKVIISPGVVYQGANVGLAIDFGADFEIIGRGIYLAENPIKAAMNYVSKLRWFK